MESWHSYLLIFATTFVAVFLSGFQHMNVNGRHWWAIFVTSYAMDFAKVLLIILVVERGLSSALVSGLAAATGMILSVRFHDLLFRKPSTSP